MEKKETLEKQLDNIREKMRLQEEQAAKEAEKEFRQEMQRDTAGTVLGIAQRIQAQLASLQAQIDTINPLVPVMRSIDMMATKITEIDQRIAALEKGEPHGT